MVSINFLIKEINMSKMRILNLSFYFKKKMCHLYH